MNREDSARDDEQSCLSPSYLRLLDSDNSYSFTHAKCGVAIIINNINFPPESELPVRKDAENDHKRLEAVFKTMNFKVDVCLDLTADDMVDKMREVACNINYDHTDADCFACAILSHGSDVVDKHGVAHDVLLGTDGKTVFTRDLVSPFRDETCPYLHGKPKLFFIEACHGGDADDADIESSAEGDSQGQSSPKERLSKRKLQDEALATRRTSIIKDNVGNLLISPTPLFKDFLVMYATSPGYRQRGKSGSLFIEHLGGVFHNEKLRDLSLARQLSRVCQKMSLSSVSETDDECADERPMACVMSMLTKDLYFRR